MRTHTITHLGITEERLANVEYTTFTELAEAVSDIDIIIDGHSHTLLYEPIKKNNTWVTQVGDWGKYIGKFEVTIDAGKILKKEWQIIPVNTSPENNDIYVKYPYFYDYQDIPQ